MEKVDGTDFDEVLDKIGFGKVHWWLFFVGGLLMMGVYNEVMGISFIVIASQCELETNDIEKSIINNAAFVGMIVSSYYLGYLTDNIGRKKILLYSTFLSNLMSCLSSLMPTFWLFVTMRVMVGIFGGGPGMITVSYVAEFCKIELRPLVITLMSLFICISMIYVSGAAWLLKYMNWYLSITATFGLRPWRFLIIINMLPGFIAALILRQLKESPKFLLSIGKEAEAFQVVEWMCEHNTGKCLADLEIYKLSGYQQRESLNQNTNFLKQMCIETRPLFRRPHVRNFVLCSFIMFGLFLVANGMGLWFPIILNNEVAANSGNHTVCDMWSAIIVEKMEEIKTAICNDQITSCSSTIFLGIVNAILIPFFGLVIKFFRRKRAFILCMVVAGLCGLSLTWLEHPVAIIICFIMFLSPPGIAVSLLSSTVVDMTPTHLRGKALCLIFMFGRMGAVSGSAFIGAFLHLNCLWAFNTFVIYIFVCAALAFLIPL